MSLMRAALFLPPFALAFAIGCGPSPAMQPSVATPCEIDDDEEVASPPVKPVEYVRIDEWQAPPSVQEIESRIEPRGTKPPDYVRLPKLTLHREIAPMTTYRTGRYWH
jgi:hypothetical protein